MTERRRSDDEATRRTFLKLTGAGVAAAGFTGVSGTAAAETKNGWSTVESPTGKTLYDAVLSSEGPYAVGGGGDVIARRADGWELVLEKGPTTESNPLRGAGVSDDGRNVWFAGGSGVVGQYDVVDEQLTDYSAPKGKTSTWLNVAVTGPAGDERVYLVNGSGEFLPGRKTDAGGMDWGEVVKPGGGSSAPGIDFYDETEGFVSDTNSKVYQTDDGGSSFETVGIEGGSVGLYGVASVSESDVNVAGGSGRIFYYVEDEGFSVVDVGSDTVRAVDRDGTAGLAAGAGGFVYDREGVGNWTRVETPTTNTLRGTALDASDTFPDVAVGSSGTIIERGSYDADLPNTLTISTSVDTDTGYRVEVDGAVEKEASVESGDTVENNLGTPDVIEGTVGGTDTEDSYSYSGAIVDFSITSGDATNVTITVNGTEKTVEELDDDPWVEAESPTGKTLNGVVESTEGPYAVGGGGQVTARRTDGWELVVDGFAEGNTLNGAAASDDGVNVWFAGGSGAVGKYDVVAEEVTDYSAPKGKTSTWEDVAVAGTAGAEFIYLVNGSGEVLRGENDAGEVDWGEVIKPGGGSSMKGVTFIDDDTGYICDTNAKVYETTDGGDSYDTIGIPGGSVGLYGVDAVSPNEVNVAGGDGSIFRYNGAVWTKLAVTGSALASVDRDGEDGLACGGSGTIAELAGDGWETAETPTGNGLESIVIGTTYPDVAVGGSGTILERQV